MTEEFKKYDGGKLDYSLFPASVTRDVIEILMFGATKYGKHNWKKCTDNDRYYNALMRHIDAFRDGEYLDPETNKPHLAHALCNLVFMHYLEQEKKNVTKVSEAGTSNIQPGSIVRYGKSKGIPSSVWDTLK